MSEQFDQQPLDHLLSRLADESATSEEVAALEQILLDDAAARQCYVHYLDLHEELRLRANEGRLSPPALPSSAFWATSDSRDGDSFPATVSHSSPLPRWWL